MTIAVQNDTAEIDAAPTQRIDCPSARPRRRSSGALLLHPPAIFDVLCSGRIEGRVEWEGGAQADWKNESSW